VTVEVVKTTLTWSPFLKNRKVFVMSITPISLLGKRIALMISVPYY